jgi:glyceraldehyde 3-phosphate dehydrogenase
MKVAINGFGRIGRLAFRALLERGLLDNGVEVVAVNDLVPSDNLAYLLKYDSVHGKFPQEVTAGPEGITVGGRTIKTLMIKDGPAAMPWANLGVDLVIESTGVFTKRADAAGHLAAGAKKVMITAPAGDTDATIIVGVNDNLLNGEQSVFNAASCTTNCTSPILHVLMKEGIGVEEALLTTVHSYTAKQLVVDGPSKKDMRAGRAAATNIIPSSTGAAEAVVMSLPELQGKITGMSIRVPTADVSLIDLTVRTARATSLEEITAAMKKASESYLQGILGVTTDPVVSSDFIHDPRSAIFDVTASIQLNDRFFKLIAWYDNEWGYSNRLVDLVAKLNH